MTQSETSTPNPPTETRNAPSPGWLRLLLGAAAGAVVGLGLAWFAGKMTTEGDGDGEDETAVGPGELVSLGIETLGFIRLLFKVLKRM